MFFVLCFSACDVYLVLYYCEYACLLSRWSFAKAVCQSQWEATHWCLCAFCTDTGASVVKKFMKSDMFVSLWNSRASSMLFYVLWFRVYPIDTCIRYRRRRLLSSVEAEKFTTGILNPCLYKHRRKLLTVQIPSAYDWHDSCAIAAELQGNASKIYYLWMINSKCQTLKIKYLIILKT